MSRPRKIASDLDPAELDKQLDAGKVEPLYLFLGEETYLKEQAIKRLAATVEEAFRAFNVTRLSLKETSLAAALDAARQMPMMARRRLVVISDLDQIKDEAAIDALIEYLRHPVETTCLVFTGRSLDGRRRYAAPLRRACVVVGFDSLDEREVRARAEKYLRARGVQIEPSALGLLIGLTGTGLTYVTNELEKLVTHAGRARRITTPDVEALVPRTRQHDNFELGDAVLAGERQRALRLLRRVMADGAEPVALVGMLAWAFRRMLVAKELMQRNAPMPEVAREAKVSPYAHDFFAQARRIDLDKLVRGLQRLAEVDLALKSTAATPQLRLLRLEHLICELTSPTSFN